MVVWSRHETDMIKLLEGISSKLRLQTSPSMLLLSKFTNNQCTFNLCIENTILVFHLNETKYKEEFYYISFIYFVFTSTGDDPDVNIFLLAFLLYFQRDLVQICLCLNDLNLSSITYIRVYILYRPLKNTPSKKNYNYHCIDMNCN